MRRDGGDTRIAGSHCDRKSRFDSFSNAENAVLLVHFTKTDEGPIDGLTLGQSHQLLGWTVARQFHAILS